QLIEIDKFCSKWNRSKKKMLLVGTNRPNSIEKEYLKILEEDESVVVFTETTSNLHSDSFFPSIDKIIAPITDNEFSRLQPDILLTLGGLVVSKKIKAFLRAYKPKEHWHVDIKKANDTFFCLTKHFKTDVNSFFKEFFGGTNMVHSDYRNHWLKVKEFRRKMHNLYMNKIPFSDFLAFGCILKSLPDFSNVQVGNSSAIRYTQLFDLNKTLNVYCNRGTSGIDGSTSTAIGSSIIAKNQTIYITGDLSFFYDSNALWNDYIPNSFRVILINNQGGGIFRILPGHKNTDNFDTYFETKHNLTASQLCDMYGFNYFNARSEKELKKELSDFYKKSIKPQLIEIFTPRTINDSVLLDYFEFIK
ncbi:MAG: 2-succinyl-5-enolpyruvyl-6-hydroxy-3-cyclohexene-1-carboxylate synthase, partial [Bacteroidia bacterium]|nr:2-succinyl-5-enolpyruvyl-6-hydroxy-3-cyclohexene-1-carboxylate synthase [Bacteroidia bacterium]